MLRVRARGQAFSVKPFFCCFQTKVRTHRSGVGVRVISAGSMAGWSATIDAMPGRILRARALGVVLIASSALGCNGDKAKDAATSGTPRTDCEAACSSDEDVRCRDAIAAGGDALSPSQKAMIQHECDAHKERDSCVAVCTTAWSAANVACVKGAKSGGELDQCLPYRLRRSAPPGASSMAAAPTAEAGATDEARAASRLRQMSLRQAAVRWSAMHAKDGCPDVNALVQKKQLASVADGTDAWGTVFAIRCKDDDVTVVSAGPDRAFATGDDVAVPTTAQ